MTRASARGRPRRADLGGADVGRAGAIPGAADDEDAPDADATPRYADADTSRAADLDGADPSDAG